MDKNSAQSHPFKGWSKITILLMSVFLTLLAAEGASRIILRRSSHTFGEKIHDYFYFDPNGVFRIQPNSRGSHFGFDGKPIMVTTNSDGFRGRELRASPAQRIIFIGDSIVFNGGMQHEETFIALLENQLQRDGYDVEVINAGATDLGINQYLLQAKHNRFEIYKPDLVVIGLYLNDSRPPQGFLGEGQDKFVSLLKRSPFKHLAITHFLRQGYFIVQQKRGKQFSKRFKWIKRYNSGTWIHSLQEFQKTVTEAQFDWGAAWDTSFEETVYPSLSDLKEIYSSKGVEFAVVLFPVSAQVYTNLTDPFINHPQRQLSKFARQKCISWICSPT